MKATSRESLAAVRDYLDEFAAGADTQSLRRIGEELAAVVGVLAAERELRRYLTDPSAAEADRQGFAGIVFGGKVDESTLQLLRRVAGQRWSRPGDVIGVVEQLSREALLTVADRDEAIEEVEDELFRFGRMLNANPHLAELLTDMRAPVPNRIRLLRDLLAGKVNDVTLTLIEHAMRTPRGRSLDVVAAQLAELAAARRGRSVAHVTAAAPLTDEQEERLGAVLSRIYGRNVSLEVVLDPEVLGGLIVRVGDEVIDGSILARLGTASREFPS